MQEADADAVYATLRRQLFGYGLDVSFIVGFGSDGASVMTGKHNGVGAKLKRDVGHVFAIHCVAHRLALATFLLQRRLITLVAMQIPYGLFAIMSITERRTSCMAGDIQ